MFYLDEWVTLRTAVALHAKKAEYFRKEAEYFGKEAGAENSLESVNALRKRKFLQNMQILTIKSIS